MRIFEKIGGGSSKGGNKKAMAIGKDDVEIDSSGMKKNPRL